jgi:SAM-dependent methyltransferase
MPVRDESFAGAGDDEFFRQLYEGKPEYIARREQGSLESRLICVEVDSFKIPNLLAVLPRGFAYSTVVEIGCATGELLAGFPAPLGARKVGFDISRANVECASERHLGVEFRSDDFRSFVGRADIVILSDVLEHVPDDAGMLRDAARIGSVVLLNLPLEDNWLNRRRNYGPDDVSGHLRRYTLRQGLALVEKANLDILHWHRRWIHETDCDLQRRRYRRAVSGAEFSGGALTNAAKHAIVSVARAVQPFGRRLFASNLFASITQRQVS